MMRQMGMSQEELKANKVIIETEGKTYIFENPQVQKIVMQGQTSFQITGNYKEEIEKITIDISEDDIKLVSEQAGVSIEDARKALEKSNGDIAQAIVNLS